MFQAAAETSEAPVSAALEEEEADLGFRVRV